MYLSLDCPPFEELRQQHTRDWTQIDTYLQQHMRREEHIRDRGFVLVSQECKDALVALLKDKHCLEAGSGTGWLSEVLSRAGVRMCASDLGGAKVSGFGMRAFWRRDHEGNSLDLLPGEFDAVLLCWPPYSESFGAEVAQKMRPGQLLVLQGEGQGGCTGDDALFEELASDRWEPLEDASDALNQHHVQFWGIHDYWSVWRRTGA